MKRELKKYKKTIQSFFLAICLIYIFYYFQNNKHDFKKLLEINSLSIIGIFIFVSVSHFIYSIRFRIILKKHSGVLIPYSKMFKLILLGRFLNLFVPQAGNIYRSVNLKNNYKISYTNYIGVFFAFTWLDLLVNLIVSVIVILIFQPSLTICKLNASVLVGSIIVVIILTPIIFEILFKWFSFKNKQLNWLHQKFSQILGALVNSTKDLRYISSIVLTGIIAFVNSLIIFYILFRGIEISISVPTLALFYVVLKLSNQIFITPGNFGIRELAYGILGTQLNISMADGIMISVILRIVGTCVIVVAGVFWGGIDLLRHKKELRQESL